MKARVRELRPQAHDGNFGRIELPPAVVKALHRAARKHCVSVQDIRSKWRPKHLVAARRTAALELRMLGHSLHQIGRYLGGLDHSTISHYLDMPQAIRPYDFSKPDESGIWAI